MDGLSIDGGDPLCMVVGLHVCLCFALEMMLLGRIVRCDGFFIVCGFDLAWVMQSRIRYYGMQYHFFDFSCGMTSVAKVPVH